MRVSGIAGMLMLVAFCAAVPEAEDDARRHEAQQGERITPGECLDGFYSGFVLLIGGTDAKVGNAVRQREQVGIRLVGELRLPWNIGLCLRHE